MTATNGRRIAAPIVLFITLATLGLLLAGLAAPVMAHDATPTPSASGSGSATASPSSSPTGSATASPTTSPTASATASQSATPTGTPTGTPTASPTATPEQSLGGGTPTPTPEQSVQGGTGTPAPSQPDTAMAADVGSPVASLGYGLVLLAALMALAVANVKTGRRRTQDVPID